jgi:hypothetical protein
MHLDESLEAFFQGEVDRAFKAEGLPSGGPAEGYLVQLLATYAAQPIEDRPLGVRLIQALEASPRERRSCLREIGDTSLFLSGFWGDSLGGKLIDVDYYVDLGGTAYRELARDRDWPRGANGRERDDQQHGARATGDVFAELAAHFGRFVGVLMTISHRTTRARSDRDIVRLYDRWMRTKSSWAARRLVEAGVIAREHARGTVH